MYLSYSPSILDLLHASSRGIWRERWEARCFSLKFIKLKCVKPTAEDDDPRFNTRPLPSSPPPFCKSLSNRFLSKIYIYLYICVYVCFTVPSCRFSLLVHGVDRPPNARVLRTDIRTIKELLMVRIWSRWAADVRRRNQSYRYFVPPARRLRSHEVFSLTIVHLYLGLLLSLSLSSSLIFASNRWRWRWPLNGDQSRTICDYFEYSTRELTKLVVLQKTAYKTFSVKKTPRLERLCFSSLIFGSCKLRLRGDAHFYRPTDESHLR